MTTQYHTTRDTRRKDNGTREEFYAHFTPEYGGGWACTVTDIDGNTYSGCGSQVSSAVNDAASKMREALGHARMGRGAHG